MVVNYRLEVAENENFGSIIKVLKYIEANSKEFNGFEEKNYYFCRIAGMNDAGRGNYSEIRDFGTGFPVLPNPLYLVNKENIDLFVSIEWSKLKGREL